MFNQPKAILPHSARPRVFEHTFLLPGYSDAQSMQVAIEGIGPDKGWLHLEMTKRPDGVWAATTLLPIKTHHYLFVRDGETPLLDPRASSTEHEGCGAVSLLFARGT